MSTNMKLIMENWRSNILHEAPAESLEPEGELFGQVMDAAAEKAMEDILANQKINEVVVTTSLAIGFVIQIASLMGIGAFLSKIGNVIHKKVTKHMTGHEQAAAFLEGAESFLTAAVKHIISGGTYRVIKYGIEKLYANQPAMQDQALKDFEKFLKIFTFVVLMGAGINEIAEGAKESGSVLEYINQLVRNSGMGNEMSSILPNDELANLMDMSLDTAELTYDGVKFVEKALETMRNNP